MDRNTAPMGGTRQTRLGRPTDSSSTARTVLGRFPAGAPRGSWPAEEFATSRRVEGLPAEVVMDLPTDTFLVVTTGGAR